MNRQEFEAIKARAKIKPPGNKFGANGILMAIVPCKNHKIVPLELLEADDRLTFDMMVEAMTSAHSDRTKLLEWIEAVYTLPEGF
jgi:hypothetical protein